MNAPNFSEPGGAWIFGDDVDTDVLAPGIYMKGSFEELARHCLEALDPGFAPGVQRGDIVVGGNNFGIGSSREQAAQALKHLGVKAVIARSFGGIFFRNAINAGIPCLVCTDAGRISKADRICFDMECGQIKNLSTDEMYSCETLPSQLADLVRNGGLVPHLEKSLRLKSRKDSHS